MINFDYLYNPDAAKESFGRDYFLDKKLGFRIIENGTVLPHKRVIKPIWGLGGIVDSEGNFIRESSLHYGTGGAYTPPPQDIRHSSETVIYLGIIPAVWGHSITDNIRRIWFLKSEVFKSEFKNCPIVYVAWREGRDTIDIQPDFKRLLSILGINSDTFQAITQPTQFKRIILPDESFISPHNPGTGFTAEYREAIERIRHFGMKNRTPTSSKKIYFFLGKRQAGEEHMADYLKSKGYAIITHEQRSDFDEELNLLVNAESFATPMGSCSMNSIFLRDNTETILIPRYPNPKAFSEYNQVIIDQVHPLDVKYVDSTMSVFGRDLITGPYCFIISKQLKRFFGDKWDGYKEADFNTFLDYVRGPVRGVWKFNPNQMKYYGSVFTDFMEQLKKREDLIAACDMPTGWETFRPVINYITHVNSRGWRDGWKGEKQSSNPLDQQLEVLAIAIKPPLNFYKIFCSVYFNDEEGWSPEVVAPEVAGTRDKNKPIFGMRIRFDEAGSKEYDILYRMHKFDDTWTPWAKNGEALYSHGVKLNAIQIKLEPKT